MPAKKVLTFDNLDDINGKFFGTICYYKGQAVFIKHAISKVNEAGLNIPGKFQLYGETMLEKVLFDLDDPLFNYKQYNIGYVNMGIKCPFYYRMPVKQFKQGLKADQVSYIIENPFDNLPAKFGFTAQFISMLENKYPSMEEVEHYINEHPTSTRAFHRDFAISFDELHDDYVLEYRAVKVGVAIQKNLKIFKLSKNSAHLAEALTEALG